MGATALGRMQGIAAPGNNHGKTVPRRLPGGIDLYQTCRGPVLVMGYSDRWRNAPDNEPSIKTMTFGRMPASESVIANRVQKS